MALCPWIWGSCRSLQSCILLDRSPTGNSYRAPGTLWHCSELNQQELFMFTVARTNATSALQYLPIMRVHCLENAHQHASGKSTLAI
eukprot:CAMPEP_0114630112 /NCGR_PEP_ID=MMETSP0168-20121206/13714_1 /TAXON_ID=95228 ORGANISM="Vannella sp., Strain DIVA3 517/6/12" /NCGR_SAMPLE_ID=MMETSP0168 /ASSEMBLY_ACC=CAM_ASM_000044 /LENGTH=86 /DNA_ID=CAMNT_0001841607 /DNA_START=53 /DNA_END=313 /DNA_ORIENTATION=-